MLLHVKGLLRVVNCPSRSSHDLQYQASSRRFLGCSLALCGKRPWFKNVTFIDVTFTDVTFTDVTFTDVTLTDVVFTDVRLLSLIIGYNAWREFCGLTTSDNFDELSDISERNTRNKFKNIYK